MAGKNFDKNWFKKWFGTGDYLELYKHRNSSDASKIAGLITRTLKLPRGSRVLDVACGNGRHSLIFASKGFNVLGIDLSAFLIGEAKKKLRTEYSRQKDHLKFEIRDMRNIDHRNEFDLAVNLFSSFGYFEKDSENFRVFGSIARALKPGGYFFFDYLNESALREKLVPSDVSVRNHNAVVQVREIKNNAVYKTIYIVKNSPGKGNPEVSVFHEMIKLYSLEKFKAAFAKSGLDIIRTFGDYHGKRYNKHSSERLIILARKKKQ